MPPKRCSRRRRRPCERRSCPTWKEAQVVPGAKEQVSLRLDREVLDYFQEGGPGWQDRINEALRKVAASCSSADIASPSFRPDIRCAHRLAPLRRFPRRGRSRTRRGHAGDFRAADAGEPRADRRIGQRSDDFPVEQSTTISAGGSARRTDAAPGAGLVARNGLGDRRHVRQRVRARCGRHRKSA